MRNMKITLQEKYLSVVLITFSGLMLIINNVLIHIRHGSTIYHKYYREIPQHSFIHHGSYYNQPVKNGGDEDRTGHNALSKFAPVLHIASSYTKFSDVIPRTVYHESLVIDGFRQSVIIVLAEVNWIVLEQSLIVSCQIKDQFSTHLEVVPDPIMEWIKTHKKGYTHYFSMIYCFGFQKKFIQGGGTVQIIYRTDKNGSHMSVRSENLLNGKLHTVRPNSSSVVVCATMYGHPARFDEWLRYQKTIGVDMVHVSAQVSFIVAMEQYPFLSESLNNGFVKIQVWKEYLKENEIFYHSQSLVYQDCLMQYRHSFEYAMMIDYDDFFIPAISKKINIHYYLSHLFGASTASIRLPWIQYHCKPMNYTSLVDGNVTRILSGQDLNRRSESKSIHKLDAVEIVSIHSASKTKTGYTIEKVSGVHVAYFAHIRPSKRQCKLSSR